MEFGSVEAEKSHNNDLSVVYSAAITFKSENIIYQMQCNKSPCLALQNKPRIIKIGSVEPEKSPLGRRATVLFILKFSAEIWALS